MAEADLNAWRYVERSSVTRFRETITTTSQPIDCDDDDHTSGIIIQSTGFLGTYPSEFLQIILVRISTLKTQTILPLPIQYPIRPIHH